MRVPDRNSGCVGYRLNIIGVGVWKDYCQLLAKDRFGVWQPFGPTRPLPVVVPADPAGIMSDPLLLTAYHYNKEHPGSDLIALLARHKVFDEALQESPASAHSLSKVR